MKFIVLWQGRWPVHFHANVCGKVYSAVAEAEATRFDSERDAEARALEHSLRFGQFIIKEVAA